MRILLFFLTLVFFSCDSERKNNEERNVTINATSFNIRYNNPNDGDNIWENRREMVVDVFFDNEVDIGGLQEVTEEQLNYLIENLEGYSYIGVGREDGHLGGELSPIFYQKEKFSLIENGTQWLSETPEIIGSIGWDAALPRIFTWGKFKEKKSGKIFFFFNTHFDHRGEVARLESSRVLKEKTEAITGGEHPVIVTGDFNYTRESDGYAIMTDDSDKISLNDAKEISETPFEGKPISINGFNEDEADEKIIDFIFVSDDIEVQEYDILKIKEGKVYVSDHYPILSRLFFD